jgi:hypothetical protein
VAHLFRPVGGSLIFLYFFTSSPKKKDGFLNESAGWFKKAFRELIASKTEPKLKPTRPHDRADSTLLLALGRTLVVAALLARSQFGLSF